MNPQMPFGYAQSMQGMMPPMFPNQPYQDNNYLNLEKRVKDLEQKVKNIENKLSMDNSNANNYKTNLNDSYQSSMYMM